MPYSHSKLGRLLQINDIESHELHAFNFQNVAINLGNFLLISQLLYTLFNRGIMDDEPQQFHSHNNNNNNK